MSAPRKNPHLSPPRSWYELERWRRRRRAQLRAEPLCALCLNRGIVTVATVADHVTPHGGDWNRFLTAPLQSLCAVCHNNDKRYMDLHGKPRPIIGDDGWPIESQTR